MNNELFIYNDIEILNVNLFTVFGSAIDFTKKNNRLQLHDAYSSILFLEITTVEQVYRYKLLKL